MKTLSVDPGGLVTKTTYEDGRNVIKYEQDVQDHLDVASELRADTGRWEREKKESFAHAAFVPDIVILDMRTRFGVNFYDKEQRPKVMQLLETEYKRFKTTDKKLYIPR